MGLSRSSPAGVEVLPPLVVEPPIWKGEDGMEVDLNPGERTRIKQRKGLAP